MLARSVKVILLAMICCAAVSSSFAMAFDSMDECIAHCERMHPLKNSTSVTRTFCGTDGLTHNLTFAYSTEQARNPRTFDPFRGSYDPIEECVFRTCHLAAISANGTCECPANCFSFLGRGTCTPNGCLCAMGWRGQDCSLPSCPANLCSGHGKCKHHSDRCHCEPKWTGYLCDAPVTNLTRLPYGELRPVQQPFYSKHDKYGDYHPVFNLSVLTVINISMDPSSLQWLLDPLHDRNETGVRADLTMVLDGKDVDLPGVRMSSRGDKSRTEFKRPFKVDLDAYEFPSRKLHGLKAFSLDAPFGSPTLVNVILMNDFYRMAGIVGYRISVAQLFINEIYYGIYLITEETDDTFVKDHWNNDTGNYYKVNCCMYLANISEPHEKVRMKGDINWTSWDHFVDRLNSDNMTVAEFASLVNLERLTRGMVLDIFSIMSDGYIENGNNYGFYGNPATGLLDYTTRDYETSLYHNASAGIYVDNYIHKHGEKQVLFVKIAGNPQLLPLYTRVFKAFLAQAFSPKSFANMLARTTVYGTIVANQLNYDAFYNFEGARSGSLALAWVEEMIDWFPARARVCAAYLNMTLDI